MRTAFFRAHAALAALVLVAAVPAAAQDCNPAWDRDRPQYILGYGSLMETASKRRTAPDTGPSRPVLVTGFQRAWNARGAEVGHSATYLGVQRQDAAQMVAVLYRVFDAAGLAATDKREFSYCRAAVDPGALKMLDGSAAPTDGQIWIYENKPDAVHGPTPRWPIVQSYVDVFLTGCLQQKERVVGWNEDFAEQCIVTTAGWSAHWVNDRIHPRRPFVHQPNAGTIDRLLNALVPEQFQAIRIE